MKYRNILLCQAGLSLVFCVGQARAQTLAAQEVEVLSDIVVTAQRRSEKLQDIPIAISAFSQDTLAQSRINTTEDLKLLVPSLQYSNVGGYAEPYLRAIGNSNLGPNLDPEVATYEDGVFMSNNVSSTLTLMSVDRVEVLAGPQGTLYGRNAVGGAINVITRTPSSQPEGEVSLGYSNYNRVEGSGYTSGPITDTLSGGIYAAGMERDSYYRSTIGVDSRAFPGTPHKEQNWAARTKLVYESGGVKLVATGEHGYSNSHDSPVYRNVQANGLGVALGAPFINQRFVETSDAPEFKRTTSNLGSLLGEFDLGFAKLVSLTAYRDVDAITAGDGDGTSAPVFFSVASMDIKDYSQEIRLQSKADNRIKWLVGAYGFYEDSGFTPSVAASAVLYKSFLGPGTWAQQLFSNIPTKSWAVFGESTIPITDALNLTVGARYSDDDKTFRAHQYFSSVVNGAFGAPFGLTPSTPPSVHANWGSFTPKVTLDYRVGGTLLYATYSKGYKSGAFNPTVLGSKLVPVTPAKPETLDAYEIGSKSDFLGNRLRLNTALYYNAFHNIQVKSIDPITLGQILRNAAGARTYGAEVSTVAVLAKGLVFEGSGSVEDTKYGSFPGLPVPILAPMGNTTVITDVSGKQLPRAPRFVGTASLSYTRNIADKGALKFGPSVYYNSGFFWDSANLLPQRSYGTVNLSATYTSPDSRWLVTAYAKNVTDAAYSEITFATAFGTLQADADPRTFGLTVTRKLF
jgi:iron complex outermembrane receptor protein